MIASWFNSYKVQVKKCRRAIHRTAVASFGYVF